MICVNFMERSFPTIRYIYIYFGFLGAIMKGEPIIIYCFKEKKHNYYTMRLIAMIRKAGGVTSHHFIFFCPTTDCHFSCDVHRSNHRSYKNGESLPSYASSATSVSDRHSLLLWSEKVSIIGHALHFW